MELANIHIPSDIMYILFDKMNIVTKLSIAMTCKTSVKLFENYLDKHSSTQEAHQTYQDVAKEIFKSRYATHGTVSYILLQTTHSKTSDLQFLITLPDETLKKLHIKDLLSCPEKYPRDIAVRILKQKLPASLLGKIWEKKFTSVTIDNFDFVSYDKDGPKRYEATEEHGHFNKLTNTILTLYKNSVNINDQFLKLMCYWGLDTAFIELYRMRRHYHLTKDFILPYLFLFERELAVNILECIGDDFNIADFYYLNTYLRSKDMIYLTGAWKGYSTFQQFLKIFVGLPMSEITDSQLEFYRWLKSYGSRYIRQK